MKSLNSYPQFLELARNRYSCRKFDSRPVSRGLILAVIEAAQLAPSAKKQQPWTFLVIEGGDARREVAASYGRDWINTAPVYIVALGDKSQAWVRPVDGKNHMDVDLSIAIEHMCLAATSLGLGTCWVCNFDAPALKSALGLPETVEPVAIIPLGYPAEDTQIPLKKRKQVDEIVKWGKF